MSVLAALALALALTFGHQLEDPLTSDTAALVVLAVWCVAGAAAAITAIVDAYIRPEGELLSLITSIAAAVFGVLALVVVIGIVVGATGVVDEETPIPEERARAGFLASRSSPARNSGDAIANAARRDRGEQENDTGEREARAPRRRTARRRRSRSRVPRGRVGVTSHPSGPGPIGLNSSSSRARECQPEELGERRQDHGEADRDAISVASERGVPCRRLLEAALQGGSPGAAPGPGRPGSRRPRAAAPNRAGSNRRVQTRPSVTRPRLPRRSPRQARRPRSGRRRGRGVRLDHRQPTDRERAGNDCGAQRPCAEGADEIGDAGARRRRPPGRSRPRTRPRRPRAARRRSKWRPSSSRTARRHRRPGTCPDATAPTTQPRKKGTSTDESANVAPSARASEIVAASPRRANAAPRRMIPTAARNSGTYRVSMIGPKAFGKHVQSTTRTKISQTWLASQTGPIERLMSPRTRAPRSAPPAVRSQNPAPKSAPPSTA